MIEFIKPKGSTGLPIFFDDMDEEGFGEAEGSSDGHSSGFGDDFDHGSGYGHGDGEQLLHGILHASKCEGYQSSWSTEGCGDGNGDGEDEDFEPFSPGINL